MNYKLFKVDRINILFGFFFFTCIAAERENKLKFVN